MLLQLQMKSATLFHPVALGFYFRVDTEEFEQRQPRVMPAFQTKMQDNILRIYRHRRSGMRL